MTGYRGMRPLFSLWIMSDALRGALAAGASPLDLEPPTLFDDALRVVLAGETSVEECLRVLSPADV
jgi:type II secretory ATPase GspE/PulE/Tfp pilus assembly ATPase PilB-like protein